MTTPARLADWDSIEERSLHHHVVAGVDLVVTRLHDEPSVLYGRCLHRGALLADGAIRGENLVCGVHGWDYRVATGVSAYDGTQRLHRFGSWIDDGGLWIDRDEVEAFERDNPQPYDRSAYQGVYQDPHGTPAEPHVGLIRSLAGRGLEAVGPHGPVTAMGVTRDHLPSWDSIQFATAQLARPPLLDDHAVDVGVTIGPAAMRPLRLDIPLLVSDMSFGALSEEAKIALALGADAAGTGICSGEGGMLPAEQEASRRYLYELGSGEFGWDIEHVRKVQAFHLKFGQGAKTGTGGHLPGVKVRGRIAEIRHLPPGTDAISPATFTDALATAEGQLELIAQVREVSGGIPVGVKLSAQRIEDDLDAALALGVDYVILDGRGGGTGAAPLLLRDNISVPTIPALARARRHLDKAGAADVTLVVTGGLRVPADFAKALALGADVVAVANSAMQAIGCIAMRACHTGNCPVGITTQDPHLRSRLPIQEAGARLGRFLTAATELVAVIARACGHDRLSDLSIDDLTTFDREMHHLTGIPYGGVEA
ncbi:MAG: Rieske 2Fe-2S domain-containing protein [Acidimicrobiia bacterium]|nr:Rieske 2Fe-2S domain-containing protein [Acidimicrobiia bacterium]